MKAEDDPEARIRDLERPLADRAHTSELGTTPYPTTEQYPTTGPYSTAQPFSSTEQYPTTQPYSTQQHYPPPPPPPGYAAPYGTTPPSSNSRAGVLVFVGVVLTLLVVGAGALVYFAMRPADGPLAGDPTVAGGGGQLDEPQVPQVPEIEIPQMPSMPQLPSGFPSIPVIPGSPGSTQTVEAGPGQTVSISGVQTVSTVTCNQGIVNVSGVGNLVTITGECLSVSASGMNNEITVDATGEISASGFDNTIIYRTGTPNIGSVTDSNTVRQG